MNKEEPSTFLLRVRRINCNISGRQLNGTDRQTQSSSPLNCWFPFPRRRGLCVTFLIVNNHHGGSNARDCGGCGGRVTWSVDLFYTFRASYFSVFPIELLDRRAPGSLLRQGQTTEIPQGTMIRRDISNNVTKKRWTIVLKEAGPPPVNLRFLCPYCTEA
jgi:hypothetical protein